MQERLGVGSLGTVLGQTETQATSHSRACVQPSGCILKVSALQVIFKAVRQQVVLMKTPLTGFDPYALPCSRLQRSCDEGAGRSGRNRAKLH